MRSGETTKDIVSRGYLVVSPGCVQDSNDTFDSGHTGEVLPAAVGISSGVAAVTETAGALVATRPLYMTGPEPRSGGRLQRTPSRETEGVAHKPQTGQIKSDASVLPEHGEVIDGRYYTRHALEKMAPDTIQVRAELEARARSIEPALDSPDFFSYITPRGIPRMVIEDTIRSFEGIPGRMSYTWEHIGNGIKVVVNEFGDVITVYKLS